MDNLRDLLRSSLGGALSTLPPVERLAAAWPVAAGHAIAERSAVTEMRNTTLVIRVHDRAWLPELRAHAPRLLAEIARIARVPPAQLTDILFEEPHERQPDQQRT